MKHTFKLTDHQFRQFFNWTQIYLAELHDLKKWTYFFVFAEITKKLHGHTFMPKKEYIIKLPFYQMAAIQAVYLKFPQSDSENILGTIVSDFDKKLL